MSIWTRIRSAHYSRRDRLQKEALVRLLLKGRFTYKINNSVKDGSANFYVHRKYLDDLGPRVNITSPTFNVVKSNVRKLTSDDSVAKFTDFTVFVSSLEMIAKFYGFCKSCQERGIYESIKIQYSKFKLEKKDDIGYKEVTFDIMGAAQVCLAKLYEKRTIGKARKVIGIATPKTNENDSVPKSNGNCSSPKTNGNGSAPKTNGNGSAPKTNGNGSAPKTNGNGSATKTNGNGSATKTNGNGSAPKSSDNGNGSAPKSNGNGSAKKSNGNGSSPKSSDNGANGKLSDNEEEDEMNGFYDSDWYD